MCFPLKFEMEAVSGRLTREIEEIEELGRDFDTQHKMCIQVKDPRGLNQVV